MRRVLLAGAAFMALAVAAPAHAVTDPVGDFLPTYVGPQDADLDVTEFLVTFNATESVFNIRATMAGDIDPSNPGLYAIGVNTGTGVIQPFANIGNPNVIFNQVVVVTKTGASFLGANLLTANVFDNVFTISVPLALLPSTGFAPTEYGWNIWPRLAPPPSGNDVISDFAPNNATMTATVPEPAAWALMIGGFAFVGGLLRRRSLRAALPV